MERLIPICDFCSSPDVSWNYDAISANAFQVEEITLASIGGWAACETCSTLIEAGDREGLRKHSLATLAETSPCPLPDVVMQDYDEFFKSVHDLFFLCKYGERKAA